MAVVALVFIIVLLTSCTQLPKNMTADTEERLSLFRRWEHLPKVKIESALANAMTYLQEQHQDLSGGFILQASRGNDFWWFDFKLLPRSPDFEINVRVFDSGNIDASPLAPRTAQLVEPEK